MEAARSEMEAAEDEFVSAVDDAMSKMKMVVEAPETLKTLNDLIKAQLAYHKLAFEVIFLSCSLVNLLINHRPCRLSLLKWMSSCKPTTPSSVANKSCHLFISTFLCFCIKKFRYLRNINL